LANIHPIKEDIMGKIPLKPIEKIDRHLMILGASGLKLHDTIVKWDNANGSEYVVERLKRLKTQFIHLLAGQPFDKDWIAYRNGVPKGPWGRVFKLGFKNPRRALSILNVYLAYANPSKSKQEGVFHNISKPMTKDSIDFVNSKWGMIKLDHTNNPTIRRAFARLNDKSSLRMNLSASLNTAKPFVEGNQQWIESLAYTSRRILPTEGITCLFYQKGTFEFEKYGGELVILPERGNKARVIAMPHAELQLALEPLHNALGSVLQAMPEDCTFDQVEGARFAQQALQEGRVVHSVDLSAATDRFPLRLQMSVLRLLNSDPHALNWASFFERTSLLKWKTPFGDITYGAGQPMGLYGSFNIFALTHHAIVQTLCRDHNICDFNNTRPYRILGDDIIIVDDELARLYKDFIRNIGVEVSESKTITSSILAEFAGYIIFKKKYFKPTKVPRDGLSVNALISYIQTMGSNPLPKYHPLYEVADLMTTLPEPYGAGFNPRGRKRLDMLRTYGYDDNIEKSLPIRQNISNYLLAFMQERSGWNEFTRSYQDGIPKSSNVILDYLSGISSNIREELLESVPLAPCGDERFQREYLVNNMDSDDKSLIYEGAVGSQFKTVKTTYISQELSWYKKVFYFFPWKT
jgi:hypothetical protein